MDYALLKGTPPRLFRLYRLKQGLEIAFTEGFRAPALDDFEELAGTILHGLGEDLER